MEKTLQLNLDIVLPEAHGAEDKCVSDLMIALQRVDGIDSVHVIRNDGEASSENPYEEEFPSGSALKCACIFRRVRSR